MHEQGPHACAPLDEFVRKDCDGAVFCGMCMREPLQACVSLAEFVVPGFNGIQVAHAYTSPASLRATC